MARFNRFQVILILILALIPPVFAQVGDTNIVGVVSDTRSAVLPDATVTILNEGNGFTRAVQTDKHGEYQFLHVPIGAYTITIDHSGFGTRTFEHFLTHIAQDARLDAALPVGSLSQKVTVSSAQPIIQTDSATVGTVIDHQMIVDMPLNGRDWTALSGLAPDVVSNGSNGTASSINANGMRAEYSNFQVDGSPYNETWYGGALLGPTPDSIAEFQIQTNMGSAEYGSGGNFVTATTVSGTNDFHGVFYDFLRNDALDSNGFWNNYSGNTNPGLKQNQFGGGIGGPILRNKLFFYTEYEYLIRRESNYNVADVITPSEMAGQFAGALKDPRTGLVCTCYDPATNTTDFSKVNLVSSIAQYFNQFSPAANFTDPNNGFPAYSSSAPSVQRQPQLNTRVDWNNAKTRVTGRYIYSKLNSNNPGTYGTYNTIGENGHQSTNNSGNFELSRALTPKILMELHAALYHNNYGSPDYNAGGPNRTVASGIGGFSSIADATGYGGFPTIGNYNGDTLPVVSGDYYNASRTTSQVQDYSAQVAWEKGRHTFKFGVVSDRSLSQDSHDAVAFGAFSFAGGFTGNTDVPLYESAVADYMTGYPISGQRSYPQARGSWVQNTWDFYGLDNWKVSSRLTVNVGLRMEFMPFPYNKRGAATFDPTLNKIVVSSKGGKIDFWSPISQLLYNANPDFYVMSENADRPFALTKAVDGKFNPRFGFAWRPYAGDKVVVRGGYGLFTMPWENDVTRAAMFANAPFQGIEYNYVNKATAWSTFYPEFNQAAAATASYQLTSFKPTYNVGYTAQYNLIVEHQLPGRTSFSYGWVGNHGFHEQDIYNLQQHQEYGPNMTLAFPNLAALVSQWSSDAYSNYNSLQVRVLKQMTHDLSFIASYSWAKALDMGSGSEDTSYIKDRFNPRANYGVSALSTRNRLVFSWDYQLPIGLGKPLFSHNRPVDLALGGWRFAGIFTEQSGRPFTVTSPTDTSGAQAAGFYVPNSQYADLVPGCSPTVKHPTIKEWFNPDCFTTPKEYTLGNSGVNAYRGDKIVNFDLSLLKDFHFTEGRYLEMRLEGFNALNNVAFDRPQSTLGDSSFGQVEGSNDGRVVQVAAKIVF